MIVDILGLLLIAVLALVLLSAAIAPLQSLGWWAGWFGQEPDELLKKVQALPKQATAERAIEAKHFLVYLSGIGIPPGNKQLEVEVPFIAALQAGLPHTVVTSDVFPYGVTPIGQGGERAVNRLWRWVERVRAKNPDSTLTWLVNVRNMLQVAVSADNRYGPIYDLGVAKEILASLLRQGYVLGSGTPITLFGYSGGGQISLGVTPFLKKVLNAPIRVISLGGVMSSDPGVLQLTRLYHLYGDTDTTDDVGAYVFPGRWKIAQGSPWNQALSKGIIEMRRIGPMTHTGPKGYLDQKSFTDDGRSYFQATLDAVFAVVAEAGLDEAATTTVERIANS